jgi:hypothetical protein
MCSEPLCCAEYRWFGSFFPVTPLTSIREKLPHSFLFPTQVGVFQQRPTSSHHPSFRGIGSMIVQHKTKMGVLHAIDVLDRHKLLQLCVLLVGYQLLLFFWTRGYYFKSTMTQFQSEVGSAPWKRNESTNTWSSSSHIWSTHQSTVSTSIPSRNILVLVSGQSPIFLMHTIEQQAAKHTSLLTCIANMAQL